MMNQMLRLPDRNPPNQPPAPDHPRGVERIIALLHTFGVLNAAESVGQNQYPKTLGQQPQQHDAVTCRDDGKLLPGPARRR